MAKIASRRVQNKINSDTSVDKTASVMCFDHADDENYEGSKSQEGHGSLSNRKDHIDNL